MRSFLLPLATLLAAISCCLAVDPPTTLDLNALAWFHGRDYFVLRSGRAQMILQADQADLGPALTFLLFDAQDARQSTRKQNAFNWEKDTGVRNSALEVHLGGFAYTALGHRTETRWELVEGNIPSVRVTWWAGGIRVTEHFVALQGDSLFQRAIDLEGAHLVGAEDVTLKLHPPQSGTNWQLFTLNDEGARKVSGAVSFEIGPLHVAPGARVHTVTFLLGAVTMEDPKAAADRAAQLNAGTITSAIRATKESWQNKSRLTAGDPMVREVFDKARFSSPAWLRKTAR